MEERTHDQTHEPWRSEGSGVVPTAIGLLSLGLGAFEVARPEPFARSIGLTEDDSRLVQLCGARELASGVAVLTNPDSATPYWARFAGDMMDLAILARGYARNSGSRSFDEISYGVETDEWLNPRPSGDVKKLSAAAAAVLGVAGADLACALTASTRHGTSRRPMRVKESVAIYAEPSDIYSFWRDFSNLPSIMTFLDSVETDNDRLWTWRASIPGWKTLEWRAEVTHDVRDERIEWRSLEGADISTEGSVEFRSLGTDRGTSITVEMEFGFTKGAPAVLQRAVRGLLNSLSEHKLKHDLKRLKQIVETGEVTTTDGQPAGRARGETLRGETWLDSVAQA